MKMCCQYIGYNIALNAWMQDVSYISKNRKYFNTKHKSVLNNYFNSFSVKDEIIKSFVWDLNWTGNNTSLIACKIWLLAEARLQKYENVSAYRYSKPKLVSYSAQFACEDEDASLKQHAGIKLKKVPNIDRYNQLC